MKKCFLLFMIIPVAVWANDFYNNTGNPIQNAPNPTAAIRTEFGLIKAGFDDVQAELETLTDDSMADALHRHSELSASDGSPNPAVSVDASGNVGISTVAPQGNLQVGLRVQALPATYPGNIIVAGTAGSTLASDGGIEFPVADDGYSYKIQGLASGGSNLAFGNRTASATWVERMRLDPAGNVGIGTAAPLHKLHIASSSFEPTNAEFGIVCSGEYGGGIGMLDTGVYAGMYLNDFGATWNFCTATAIDSAVSTHMTIKNTGNVGIGTASPATKIDVAGAITAHELSADPADPAEGAHVIWQSDGTGAGDDGDIMIKITAGGVTKTTTLVDFSTL